MNVEEKFFKAIESTEIICKNSEKRIRFINFIPDEKLEYYECEELRCIAYSKVIPKNRLKGKVVTSGFPIKE